MLCVRDERVIKMSHAICPRHLGYAAICRGLEIPSGHRMALLIGNSITRGLRWHHEASLDVLKLPSRRRALLKRVENLKGEVQKKTAEDFVRGVPTNGVALFYYIGLGLMWNGWVSIITCCDLLAKRSPTTGITASGGWISS